MSQNFCKIRIRLVNDLATEACRESESLKEQYRIAVAALGDAMMKLKMSKGTADFNRVFKKSEECRIICAKALQALEVHKDHYGC